MKKLALALYWLLCLQIKLIGQSLKLLVCQEYYVTRSSMSIGDKHHIKKSQMKFTLHLLTVECDRIANKYVEKSLKRDSAMKITYIPGLFFAIATLFIFFCYSLLMLFDGTGTPDQIKVARQLIQEKVDSYAGGGMSGGPLGGPPNPGPPPGSFAAPPQVDVGCYFAQR